MSEYDNLGIGVVYAPSFKHELLRSSSDLRADSPGMLLRGMGRSLGFPLVRSRY